MNVAIGLIPSDFTKSSAFSLTLAFVCFFPKLYHILVADNNISPCFTCKTLLNPHFFEFESKLYSRFLVEKSNVICKEYVFFFYIGYLFGKLIRRFSSYLS